MIVALVSFEGVTVGVREAERDINEMDKRRDTVSVRDVVMDDDCASAVTEGVLVGVTDLLLVSSGLHVMEGDMVLLALDRV